MRKINTKSNNNSTQLELFSFEDLDKPVVKYGKMFLLLSHAEVLEDIVEDIVGGNLADDGTEIVETLAEVLADEVAREAGVQTVDDSEQGRARLGEGFVVAGIAHDGVFG